MNPLRRQMEFFSHSKTQICADNVKGKMKNAMKNKKQK